MICITDYSERHPKTAIKPLTHQMPPLIIYLSLSYMLNSLLKKIKAEKSETHSQHSQSSQQPSKPVANQQPSVDKLHYYPQLGANLEIQSQVQRIRYRAYQSGPSLYNSIIACPISTFNMLPYAKRKVKQIDLTKDPFPSYIQPLRPILAKELPSFNHILVNVYPPGVGIMPHFDGPLYRSKVVVLSLGGPAVISFADSYKNTNKVARLLLQDQSIHIFQQQAYLQYLHGIEEFTVDSVFLKVVFQQGEKPIIVRSSVSNFHLTRLYSQVMDKLQAGEEVEEMELPGKAGAKCWLVAIRQNEEYNFKIQILRTERISLTIRQRIGSSLNQA